MWTLTNAARCGGTKDSPFFIDLRARNGAGLKIVAAGWLTKSSVQSRNHTYNATQTRRHRKWTSNATRAWWKSGAAHFRAVTEWTWRVRSMYRVQSTKNKFRSKPQLLLTGVGGGWRTAGNTGTAPSTTAGVADRHSFPRGLDGRRSVHATERWDRSTRPVLTCFACCRPGIRVARYDGVVRGAGAGAMPTSGPQV